MASCKREMCQIEPRIYVPFVLALDDESKIIEKTICG